MHRISIILLLVALGLCGLPRSAFGQLDDQSGERLAPVLEGLGDFHHSITTNSAEAQRFFDQGLILSFAFNHAEAARSFREAQRLDPDCAMCYWGEALILGPNINAGMDPAHAPVAWAALQKAQKHAPKATEKEQAYIRALSERYVEDPPEDRSALDKAYADAMRTLAQQYPDDADAQALYAEALMDTTPWDYWTEDGQPKPETKKILATLEEVIARHPEHPLALHLYIHAVEKERPEQGEAAADRLGDLVPGAGHLVHMPAHIYIRIGRYHDAAIANEKAIAADDDYLTQCHAQGLYPIGYVPHNHHFLWAAATLEGRSKTALDAARHTANHQDQDLMREPGYGTLQHYYVTPLFALVRFGKWDEILAEPKPAEDLLYPRGVWHYARGLALARKAKLDKAAQELQKVKTIAADPALESVTIWDVNTTAQLMQIAAEVLSGELAAARGNYDRAVRHLRTAADLEEALTYTEPDDWHHPVRQILGAVLLKADRPAEAEEVYREDLEKYPANGWSLYGLHQSLVAQGKAEAAAEVQEQFEAAWRYADVTLPASRF